MFILFYCTYIYMDIIRRINMQLSSFVLQPYININI